MNKMKCYPLDMDYLFLGTFAGISEIDISNYSSQCLQIYIINLISSDIRNWLHLYLIERSQWLQIAVTQCLNDISPIIQRQIVEWNCKTSNQTISC